MRAALICCSILSDRRQCRQPRIDEPSANTVLDGEVDWTRWIIQNRKKKEKKESGAFQRRTVHFSLFTLHSPNGGVAQLGEHLPCKQGVMGSNPIISTIWAYSSAG